MSETRIDDFAVAVNEIMTNAVRHGGGSGELQLWCDGDLVCEITDDGRGFPAPAYLDRRSPPAPSPQGEMGLWLAQQMTAELAIRSGTDGSTVRLKASLSDTRMKHLPGCHGVTSGEDAVARWPPAELQQHRPAELPVAPCPINRTDRPGRRRRPARVVLDMAGVTFFCAAGLSALLQAHETVTGAGGHLVLQVPLE